VVDFAMQHPTLGKSFREFIRSVCDNNQD